MKEIIITHKMSKEIITFVIIEVKEQKFHSHKKPNFNI